MTQKRKQERPDPDSEWYVPLNTLAETDISEGQTIEHASNEEFHVFALRVFTSVKNTPVDAWQDRYLRWIAVNQALESRRVIRKKKASAMGWNLEIVVSSQTTLKLEEKTSISVTGVEEKASDLIEAGGE